jgi:hypothetical protein
MATARKPIASLRWWIGGLLFASTVVNYVDRQTLSFLAPYLSCSITGRNSDYAKHRDHFPSGLFHRANRLRQTYGWDRHMARPDAHRSLVFDRLHADIAGEWFLQLRYISLSIGGRGVGQLAGRHEGGLGVVSKT